MIRRPVMLRPYVPRTCASVFVRLVLPLLAVLGAAPPHQTLIVTGTVENAEKVGLTNARVELLPLETSFAAGERLLTGGPEPEPAAIDHSDEAGRYRLQAPAPGVWRVRVTAPGSVPVEYRPLPLVESLELPPVAPKAALAAPRLPRLVHADGRTAAGVWVFAETSRQAKRLPGGWQPAFRRTLTGSSGEIEMAIAKDENPQLVLFGAGHFGLTITTAEEAFVLPTPVTEEHHRRLRIRDSAGAPLSDLLVRAGPWLWPVAKTDADGAIVLPMTENEPVDLLLLDAHGRRQPIVLPPWDTTSAGNEQTDTIQTIDIPEMPWVQGRVLDATSRRPIAGALVWTGLESGSARLTDCQGRYELPAPSRVRFWLQADAAGRRPQARWLQSSDIESGRGPTLTLGAAGRLHGWVVDSSGAAIAGAALRATPSRESAARDFFRPDPADARTVSDESGRFELDGLAPGGAYRVAARKPAHLPERLEAWVPDTDTTTNNNTGTETDLRIVLHADRPAFGRVVDADERPVEGAEVHLLASGAATRRPAEIHRRRTDAEGRFETPSLPGRRLDIRAVHAGFAPTFIRGLAIPEATQAIDLGVITLLPGASLDGHALDPDGGAIAGVEVYVLKGLDRDPPDFDPDSFADRESAATSASDGHFRITELRDSHPISLLLLHPDYLPGWLHGVEAPREQPLVARLAPALGLAGEVVDLQGTAIPGALVVAEWSERLPEDEGGRAVGPGWTRTARSNGAGRFRLSALRPGRVTLLVSAEGFVAAEPLDILLAEGTTDQRVILEPGAAVGGRVLTASGDPVSGARISAGGPVGVSDGDGFYRLSELAQGLTRLTLVHPHYRQQTRTLEIEAWDHVLDWQVPDGMPMSGTVRAADGTAITGATLTLAGHALEYRARSNSQGSFAFETVAAGSYSLHGDAEGFAAGTAPEPVEVGEIPVEDVVLILENEARVHGEVRGLDFDRLAAVRVTARDTEGRSRTVVPDYRGHYEIGGLGPGAWQLLATLEGGRKQARARVLLRPGDRQRRDLEFAGGLVLDGRVRHGDEPADGARISLRGESLDIRRTLVTNHEGAFRFEELQPDTYHLGLSDPRRFLIHNETLRLDSDREIVLDLDTGRLQGRVTDAQSGHPLDDVLLSLRRQSDTHGGDGHANSHGFLITHGADPDGSFDIVRIPPGLYAWTARRAGYSQEGDLLEVTAGGAPAWLEIALEPTPGLTLKARLASGRVPVQLHLEATDDAGRPRLRESRGPDAEGHFHFPTLPPGRWRLRVAAPGGALRAFDTEVPGWPLPIVLDDAAPLVVEVPSLATAETVARVEVLDAASHPFETLGLGGQPSSDWRLAAGRASVTDLPAGQWTVRVLAMDGRIWESPLTTDGRHSQRIVLE